MTRTLFAPVLIAMSVASVAAGQTTPPPAMPDVQTLGPQVGTKVPDFSLADQNGRTQTLESILGPKGAVLVFFRSADW
ncbi:MAG: hypothetical protein A3H97_05945 [Acidobacteria bacterium RIFCSPLOWO2_02_FULL_65_29]|nr:MAG: hypothetical protein A3H97_05945 [Acidobacteria bacterium RIFCSPLOWO2_02_FULL_65_29]